MLASLTIPTYIIDLIAIPTQKIFLKFLKKSDKLETSAEKVDNNEVMRRHVEK